MGPLDFFLRFADELQRVLNSFMAPHSALIDSQDIPFAVQRLVETYLRNSSLLAKHIEVIATSPRAGDLEELLTSMVFFFVKEKEDETVETTAKLETLKEIFFKTYDISAKAALVRGMLSLEPSDGEIEKLFLSTLRDRRLKGTTKEVMYFEYLQNEVEKLEYDPEVYGEILNLLREAKEGFPDSDLIHEIDGHLGVRFLWLGDSSNAERHLRVFYEWIVYRSLAAIKPTSLSVNSLFFLAKYAEFLLDGGEIGAAKRVIGEAKRLAKKYKADFWREFPEAYLSYTEEIGQVEEKLRGY